MMKRHGGKIAIVAILAVFAAAFYYADNASERANEGVVIEANVKGNPEAAVVLVEYSDFQCPACAVAAPVVDEIMEAYGSEIRFEYRHFPLVTINPLAIPAARAVEAAGQQGEFWAMHDLVFANQQTWSAAPNPSALFAGYAEEIGLDMALYRRHVDASLIENHIRAQFNEAREAGFTGTPTFTLNGERMEFSSYEEFAAQIEAAIGVPAEDAASTSTEAAAETDLEFAL